MSTSTSIDTCPNYEEMSPDIPQIETGGTTPATMTEQLSAIEQLAALLELKFPNLSMKLKTAGKYFSVLSSFLHKAQGNISKYAPEIISIAKKIINIAAQFAHDNPVLLVAILAILITRIQLKMSNSSQSKIIDNRNEAILQLRNQIQELTQKMNKAVGSTNKLVNERDEALRKLGELEHPQNASQASSTTNNQTSTTNNPSVDAKNTSNRTNGTTVSSNTRPNNAQTRTGIIARFCDFIAEFMEDIVF